MPTGLWELIMLQISYSEFLSKSSSRYAQFYSLYATPTIIINLPKFYSFLLFQL